MFALLPSPKNSGSDLTKTSLKPQQLSNTGLKPQKVQNKHVMKKSNNKITITSGDDLKTKNKLSSVNYDDSPDEDEVNDDDKKIDFFSLSSSVDVPDSEIQVPDIDFTKFSDESESRINSIEQSASTVNESAVNESANFISNVSGYASPVSSNEFASSQVEPSTSYIPLEQEDLQLNETAVSFHFV